MKLISLNTWCGELLDPLLKFIQEKSADTDIFCFQEVLSGGNGEVEMKNKETNLLEKILPILGDYNFHYQPGKIPYRHFNTIIKNKPLFGNATFTKKNIEVVSWEGFIVYPEEEKKEYPLDFEAAGIFLDVDIKKDGQNFSIANMHGLWGGGPKDDNLARLFQSRRALEYLHPKTGGKVLIGDFNLRPENESVLMLEKEMRNLIRENKIKTTRNPNYKNMEKFKDYIADYCFISPGLNLKDFKVLPDVVSDHQPLYLEFS